jgi:hypothetical protein
VPDRRPASGCVGTTEATAARRRLRLRTRATSHVCVGHSATASLGHIGDAAA